MGKTKLTSKTNVGGVVISSGSINTLVSPTIKYDTNIASQSPYVLCQFDNKGSNYSASNIVSAYDITIISKYISAGVYEFDIKLNDTETRPIGHAIAQASIINSSYGGWNRETVCVENWGFVNDYWRVRVITTNGSTASRVDASCNVIILAKTI